MNPVVYRDQQCGNIRRKHVVIFFCTVDPLQVQQVDLCSGISGENFQFLMLQNLFAFLPHGCKIVQIQCQIVIKKGRVLRIFQTF